MGKKVFMLRQGSGDPYLPRWIGLSLIRQWHVVYSASSHYLDHYYIIFSQTHRNQSQWNLNKDANILFQENAFEYEGGFVQVTRGIKVRRVFAPVYICVKSVGNVSTYHDFIVLIHIDIHIKHDLMFVGHDRLYMLYKYTYIYIYIYIYIVSAWL